LNHFRPAFTLIEILVSVLILSGSIVLVLKIHSQNHEQIVYLTERNKNVFEDSFFLGKNTLRYHKDEKNAYEMIQKEIKIDKYESRQILEKIKRHIFIPEPILLSADETENAPAATIDEIKLKGDYSSSYFRFNMNTF